MGLVKGFCLGALHFTPFHFWFLDGVLSTTSIVAFSWAKLPLLSLHATSFNGSFNYGLGALSLIGLPFFTSGGFYFVGWPLLLAPSPSICYPWLLGLPHLLLVCL
jgi:hypothetical protein